jgi:hypothetical protein
MSTSAPTSRTGPTAGWFREALSEVLLDGDNHAGLIVGDGQECLGHTRARHGGRCAQRRHARAADDVGEHMGARGHRRRLGRQPRLEVNAGMRDSTYPTNNRLPSPFWHGFTIQGSESANVRDSTSWSPSFAAGAGQGISTLADLHLWARALGTGSLLRPATQRARLVPNRASEAGGRAYLFALGSDHGWLGHEGSIPGYNTEVQYLPSHKATIVVLANTDIANANVVNPAPAIFQALARSHQAPKLPQARGMACRHSIHESCFSRVVAALARLGTRRG